MKSVIFILFQNYAITIRRFLLVAERLSQLGIKAGFLDFTSRLDDAIREEAQSLGISHIPEYIKYEDYRSIKVIISNYIFHILSKLTKREKTIFNDQYSETDYPECNELGKLLNLLHINNREIIDSFYYGRYRSFMYNVYRSEKVIDEIKPECIVYDTEMPGLTRSFLYAARKNNIKIISMQHAEGFGEQYINFPLLADYYVAYSPYNYEKLKIMGADDSQIFLTGFPDTDLVYNFNTEEIKGNLNHKYGINFDKTIILIALRPNNAESYRRRNNELLETCYAAFRQDSNFEIVVKQHPVDIAQNNLYFSQAIEPKYKGMKMIEGEYPVSKLFRVSKYCITFLCSAVVEAVLLNNNIIVVKENDCEKYPDWNRFNVYNEIDLEDLGTVLGDIKNGAYPHKISKANKEEFIRYFRYKFDDKSAERISQKISLLCEKTESTKMGKGVGLCLGGN